MLWSLMITSARSGSWPGDVDIGPDHAEYGLPVPCVIRTAKITTFALTAVERKVGRLPANLLADAQRRMDAHLGRR